jgi:hypothetical protein
VQRKVVQSYTIILIILKNLKMNKLILTGIILLSTLGVVAQVGIGTADPQATLDVVADNSDDAKADAILVPRMSVTELAAKDGAFLAAQNGSLVFVSAGSALAGKTSDINGVGFYYFDAPSLKWVAVGGGGDFNNPDITSLGKIVETITADTDYSSNTETFFELSTSTGAGGDLTITLPDTADNIGRFIVVANVGPKDIRITNSFSPTLSIIGDRSSTFFVSDGTYWIQSSN